MKEPNKQLAQTIRIPRALTETEIVLLAKQQQTLVREKGIIEEKLKSETKRLKA